MKVKECKMKIAFTSTENSWDAKMDPRFGRTKYILVYDEENDAMETFDNSAIENEAHGAGPKTAQKLFDLNPDILITGNGPGGNAATVLEKAGVDIYIGAGEMTVKGAYENYKNGSLQKF